MRARAGVTPPTPESTRCTLAIRGIPPAVADAYRLTYAGRNEPLASLQHSIAFDGERVTVNLVGPRYYGYKTLDREACLAGAVDFPVQRKPATIELRGAPANTTVECISGPPCPDAKLRLVSEAGGFPSLPMERDQATIELRFKASGYSPKIQRLLIQPGANRLEVELDENCGCSRPMSSTERSDTGEPREVAS